MLDLLFEGTNMLLLVAAFTLIAALTGFVGARVSEIRLATGHGDYADLATVTGTWSRPDLTVLPGVCVDPTGRFRFDPRFMDRLPVRPWRRWLDSDEGHGASLSVAIAALGHGLMNAEPSAVVSGLLFCAAGYQAATRLWALGLAYQEI